MISLWVFLGMRASFISLCQERESKIRISWEERFSVHFSVSRIFVTDVIVPLHISVVFTSPQFCVVGKDPRKTMKIGLLQSVTANESL